MLSDDWSCETVQWTELSSNTANKNKSYTVISCKFSAVMKSLRGPKTLSLKFRVLVFKSRSSDMIHIQICTASMLISFSRRKMNSILTDLTYSVQLLHWVSHTFLTNISFTLSKRHWARGSSQLWGVSEMLVLRLNMCTKSLSTRESLIESCERRKLRLWAKSHMWVDKPVRCSHWYLVRTMSLGLRSLYSHCHLNWFSNMCLSEL